MSKRLSLRGRPHRLACLPQVAGPPFPQKNWKGSPPSGVSGRRSSHSRPKGMLLSNCQRTTRPTASPSRCQPHYSRNARPAGLPNLFSLLTYYPPPPLSGSHISFTAFHETLDDSVINSIRRENATFPFSFGILDILPSYLQARKLVKKFLCRIPEQFVS